MLACALVVASHATGSDRLRISPILPEVDRHISAARLDLQNKAYDSARGHAEAILVGEELTYDVTFISTNGADQNNCLKALNNSLAIWEKDLGGTVHFREVSHEEHPQICVIFKPAVLMGQEQVAGFTNWKRGINMEGSRLVETNFHADMQLRTRDLDFHPMSFEAMRHEACHEVGHVLGLDDSPRHGDLMGPLDLCHPANGPTALEASTVRNLREEAHRIEDDARAQQAVKL